MRFLMNLSGLFLSFFACFAVHANDIQRVIPAVDQSIQKILRATGAPGAAVAIVHNDKIVFIKGYGVKEAGKAGKIDENTVFRLASVSKGFSSTLAALLAEDNIIGLDDPVVKYVPDLALRSSAQTQAVTLQHVLSQSVGLPAHTYDNLLEADMSYSDILSRLSQVHQVCAVGKCYGYQNVAYSLIGEVIAMGAGKDFGEAMRERIFQPLAMNNASVGLEGIMAASNRTAPHVRIKKGWLAVKFKPSYYRVAPAAGVNASIADMAQWLRAQMGGRLDVVSKSILTTVTTPYIRTPEEVRGALWRARLRDAHYGLGWRIFNYSGHKLVYHAGGVQGYRSEMAYLPDKRIGIVLLSNSDARFSGSVIPTFLETYLQLPAQKSLRVAKK